MDVLLYAIVVVVLLQLAIVALLLHLFKCLRRDFELLSKRVEDAIAKGLVMVDDKFNVIYAKLSSIEEGEKRERA